MVNISLKSGTNKFHGAAYWGKQTPSMNANLWFANLNGTPRGDFKYNRIGGTLNGPVILPKLYNGKNRTFFLFAYEWIKSVTANGSVLTVPTAAQRIGDFSALLKLGSSYQIYDPFSRTPAPGGRFTNLPVPGNIIPANQISPVAGKILSYYPMPDPTGGTVDSGNNLDRSSWRSLIPYRTQLYKLDHIVNDKNRLTLRANFRYHYVIDTDFFGFDNPALGTFFWNDSDGFAFDDVHSFSSTFIMDVRVSDSSFIRAQDTQKREIFDITSLGLPASLEAQISPQYRRFPAITINGYTTLAPRTWLFKRTESRNAAVSFDKIKGKHDFKFGGEYRQYPDNQTSGSASTAVNLTFSESFTRGPLDNSPAAPRGQALASLLYVIPTGGAVTIPAATDFAENSKVWAVYFQDNWKVTRKLNLNVGLRYELEGSETERYNRTVRGFDPAAQQPFEAQALASYAKNSTPEIPATQFSVRGGLMFAGVNGQPRGVYALDTNNFMPRLGFAYSLDSKTVIRGGFGMYFGSLGTRLADVLQTGFIQATQVVPTNDGGITFAATLANPFPNGLLKPTGAALGAATAVGNSVSFFNPHPAAARLHKYQVDIERELPGRFVLDLGYQGARNRELEVSRTLSALPNQYLSTSPVRDQATINNLTANLPNPFLGISQFAGSGIAGTVIPRSSLLAPFPQFTSVSYFTYDGKGWYDALNVRIEKRFAHGYTAELNYLRVPICEGFRLMPPSWFLRFWTDQGGLG